MVSQAEPVVPRKQYDQKMQRAKETFPGQLLSLNFYPYIQNSEKYGFTNLSIVSYMSDWSYVLYNGNSGRSFSPSKHLESENLVA